MVGNLGRPTALLVGLSLVGSAATAQESVLLQYLPRTGDLVRTVSWSEMTVTLGETGTETFGPESLTIEVAELESLTEFVREAAPGRHVIDVTYDSLRARARSAGGPWRIMADPVGPVAAVMMLDDRHKIGELTLAGGADPTSLGAQRLRALARRYEFGFPTGAVTAGDQWSAEVSVPLVIPQALEPAVGAFTLNLSSRATVMVDSIVPRMTDTLAFLRVQGAFSPPVPERGLEAALRVMQLRGSFTAALVWSTGWNAYVSGASRMLMTVSVVRGTSAGVLEGTTLGFDLRSRFQVRT